MIDLGKLILDMLLRAPFPQQIADGQSVSIYGEIEPLILDIEKEREEKKNYNIRGIAKQRAWPVRQWQKLLRKK